MTAITSYEPCHLPCPDLHLDSLTSEDKERGLVWVGKLRAELKSKHSNDDTESDRLKRIWQMKLKVKSLQLPNRIIKRSQNEEA